MYVLFLSIVCIYVVIFCCFPFFSKCFSIVFSVTSNFLLVNHDSKCFVPVGVTAAHFASCYGFVVECWTKLAKAFHIVVRRHKERKSFMVVERS